MMFSFLSIFIYQYLKKGCKTTLAFVRWWICWCCKLLFVSHWVNSIFSFPNTQEKVTLENSKCVFKLVYFLRPATKPRIIFHLIIRNAGWIYLQNCFFQFRETSLLSNANDDVLSIILKEALYILTIWSTEYSLVTEHI